MHAGSRWRPVCLAVHTDDGVDAAAVKQWLQSKQALKALDLSDQGLASSAGPIADSLAADKQASTTYDTRAALAFVISSNRPFYVGCSKCWYRPCPECCWEGQGSPAAA